MRVAIHYDVEGWAQWNHADGLQKYAPDWCRVSLHSLGDPCDPAKVDFVYTINLASSKPGQTSCVASHAWMYDRLDQTDWRTRGVNQNRRSQIGEQLVARLRGVICRNEALGKWARRVHRNVRVIPAGIDPAVFYPAPKPARRLRVGWCGQVDPTNPNGQFKGYEEIYRPLAERLGDRYEFEANTNTAQTRRSRDEMADWFRSLDVFLSTASAEGTPNPPFQAAACGAVVIGTDVGQLTDWAALRDRQLIVPTYRNPAEARQTVDAIAGNLAELDDSTVRASAAESLLASIERHYNYRTLASDTLAFICGRNP